jgi:Tfp pilus assembly protein PilF
VNRFSRAVPKGLPPVAFFALALVACGKGANSPHNPDRQSDAEYDLAGDAFRRGQPREALDHVLKSIDLNDENAKALKFAAEIYVFFCSGPDEERAPDCHLDLAEKYARKALSADDHFLDARNTLGSVLILTKKYDEAIGILMPLTKDPTYEYPHLAWGNIGWAQVQGGQVDQGIASLKNAVTNPRFCVGQYRLGIAYEKKGDFAQAESSLTQAVQVDRPECQNLQDAWEARARVRTKLGKQAEARADFEHCRDISADSKTGKACVQMLASASQLQSPSTH